MTRRDQLRLYFHGSLFIVLAMAFATLPLYSITLQKLFLDAMRQYIRQSHLILLLTGIWMLASGSILPLLSLTERWISIIVWNLVASGYLFIVAILLLGALFRMEGPPSNTTTQMDFLTQAPFYLGWVYLVILTISGITSFIPGAVMVVGARKSLQQYAQDAIR